MHETHSKLKQSMKLSVVTYNEDGFIYQIVLYLYLTQTCHIFFPKGSQINCCVLCVKVIEIE